MIDKISGIIQQSNITPLGSSGQSGGGVSFSNMINEVIETTSNSLNQGEIASIGALAGEVSIDELAVAVANAEMTLRTVISVRDRIVSAYQDIIKMPI